MLRACRPGPRVSHRVPVFIGGGARRWARRPRGDRGSGSRRRRGGDGFPPPSDVHRDQRGVAHRELERGDRAKHRQRRRSSTASSESTSSPFWRGLANGASTAAAYPPSWSATCVLTPNVESWPRGFARVRCPDCGFERLVAFSCKTSICPSCATRRMEDGADHPPAATASATP